MQNQQHEQGPSEASTRESAGCFRYKRSKVIAVHFFLVSAIACASAAVFAVSRSHLLGIAVLAVVFGVFMFAIYFLLFFQILTIRVDENAVSGVLFRRQWQKIDWKNVRAVRMFPSIKLYTPGRSPPTFVVSQSLQLKFPFQRNGPINFTSEIRGCRALLDLINVYVARYEIPVQSYISESGTFMREPQRVEKL